jgi:hypothetical protein
MKITEISQKDLEDLLIQSSIASKFVKNMWDHNPDLKGDSVSNEPDRVFTFYEDGIIEFDYSKLKSIEEKIWQRIEKIIVEN